MIDALTIHPGLHIRVQDCECPATIRSCNLSDWKASVRQMVACNLHRALIWLKTLFETCMEGLCCGEAEACIPARITFWHVGCVGDHWSSMLCTFLSAWPGPCLTDLTSSGHAQMHSHAASSSKRHDDQIMREQQQIVPQNHLNGRAQSRFRPAFIVSKPSYAGTSCYQCRRFIDGIVESPCMC